MVMPVPDDFTGWYAVYRPCLLGRLRQWVPGMVNGRTADDLLSEVAERVWQHWEAFTPERGTRLRWATAIARRLMIDHLRRAAVEVRRHERAIGRFSGILTSWQVAAGIPSPEAALLAREAAAAALALLTPTERPIVALRAAGYTYDEVARVLHGPPSTVKSRIQRMRARLESGGLPHATRLPRGVYEVRRGYFQACIRVHGRRHTKAGRDPQTLAAWYQAQRTAQAAQAAAN